MPNERIYVKPFAIPCAFCIWENIPNDALRAARHLDGCDVWVQMFCVYTSFEAYCQFKVSLADDDALVAERADFAAFIYILLV